MTIALIAINVGVYLLELAIGGSADGTNNSIFYKGALFAHGYFARLAAGSPTAAGGG